jgi:hypothetical protein
MYMLPLAVLFIIICGILDYPIIAICVIPSVFSSLIGFAICSLEKNDKKKKANISTIAALDIVAVLIYVGALMPIWVGEMRVENIVRWWWGNPGVLMLVTYTSGLFITNMYGYLPAYPARPSILLADYLKFQSVMHAYMALANVARVYAIASRNNVCPRCQAAVDHGEDQSLLVPNQSLDHTPPYSDLAGPSENIPKQSDHTKTSAQSGEMV